jgi:DNA invertase Pin-like site-specific DNA recombinase
MISAFAEFEREIIRERVIAGMERAKAKGKILGRPKIPAFKIMAVMELKKKGLDYKSICKKLKISKSAYYEILANPAGS